MVDGRVMVSVLASSVVDDHVMVNMLASSVVDRGFKNLRVKTKTTQLLFDVSPLSNKVKRQRFIGGRSG